MFDQILSSRINKNSSEGEEFIAEYLSSERIKFKQETPITNLKEDSKSYRKADFYLPRYKMYVEFYGLWNNSKGDRERYRIKKDVYKKNNIPCVYLYPENLGIIEYSFPKRISKELKAHSMKKELFLFRMKMLINDRGGLFIWMLLAAATLVLGDYTWEKDKGFIFVLTGIVAFQSYRLYKGFRLFFRN